MKKNLIALSLTALCLTAAPAFAGEQFEVTGRQAQALSEALKGAGAQTKVMMDASRTYVDQLNCHQGYLPGHGAFAACTGSQTIPVGGMSHAIRFVKIDVTGESARALINALEDAGVKGRHHVEFTSYVTRSVSCSSLVMGHLGLNCQIELAE